MKKWIVRFLVRHGWWRLAYRISPSLAGYYSAMNAMESFCDGAAAVIGSLQAMGDALKNWTDKEVTP